MKWFGAQINCINVSKFLLGHIMGDMMKIMKGAVFLEQKMVKS